MKTYKHPTHSYVTVVEIPKKKLKKIDFAICKQPRETLKKFYDRQTEKPDILMNGGFFHMSNGETIFNFIDDEKTVVGGHWTEIGMGVYGDNELAYGNLYSGKWRDFVAAYPPLIDEGKAVPITYATELNYKARRSVIAYDADKVYLIAIESPGMKYAQMQEMLLDMGVTHAINLDGGGSTKILQDGKSITSTVYNRAVDNVVAVYLKELKRIQVGAWKKKLYAMAFQLKVKLLPDPIKAGYKNARLVYVDGWWKVQVGAFYEDAGVQRVVDDLATHGITDIFITAKD